MSRAVLSIGSNMGDRRTYLQLAVDELCPYVQGISGVYSTPAWGPVEQPDYLNAVVIVADAMASPHIWLDRARACEAKAGRIRDVRWGPRTLDVDVITVDDVVSDDPELTLPHPRAAERAFVLVPWLEFDSSATLGGVAVTEIAQRLSQEDVALVRPEPGVVLSR